MYNYFLTICLGQERDVLCKEFPMLEEVSFCTPHLSFIKQPLKNKQNKQKKKKGKLNKTKKLESSG